MADHIISPADTTVRPQPSLATFSSANYDDFRIHSPIVSQPDIKQQPSVASFSSTGYGDFQLHTAPAQPEVLPPVAKGGQDLPPWRFACLSFRYLDTAILPPWSIVNANSG